MSVDVVAAQIDAAWTERYAATQRRLEEADAAQVLAGLNNEDANVHAKTTLEGQ